jgi:hypothetical protein
MEANLRGTDPLKATAVSPNTEPHKRMVHLRDMEVRPLIAPWHTAVISFSGF